MSFSARYLPAVLLTLLSLTASLRAQTTTKQPAKVPRGSVSGRVTIKENGVAGVAIGLRKGADVMAISRDPFVRATTDQDGFYRFTNLGPGNYSITPSVPAYVMAKKDPQSKTVLIGEDENVENINFALVRGGVITGRVTDADGRPVIEQQISLYSVENLEKRSPETPMWADLQVQTDDRGIYRMFGLNPGRYKVAAGRTDENAYDFNTPERPNYRQVFHPDATEHTKGTVIEVSEGSEANNVDIALGRAMQIFSASGVAIDDKGVPVPSVRFEVQRRVGQRIEFVNAYAASNSRGEFLIDGLIPGKYSISVSEAGGGDMQAEALSFDIIDQDIGGLTVRLSKGASLTGFIVLENQNKSLLSQLSEMQLRAISIAPNGVGNFAMSPIGADGSFRLTGLPGGTINLMLGSMMNPMAKGFVIARVERDGIVSPSTRLEIKDGEQLTGVRVIVSYGTATVRGTVKIENGSLPEGARILLRLTKPGEVLPNFRPLTVADERGHFLIDAMPAGTYELWASISDTATVQARSAKRDVTLLDGQVTELTITIDMAAPAAPAKP
ncbi:MAG TPA: carboxypeptidase regulatory-like domain-containing protein [Pyrinomonadaceae bacterium]